MKKFLMVLLVLMLLAGCVGGVYGMSSGFKDWKVNEWFTKAPATPPTSETSDKLAEVASVSLQKRYNEKSYRPGLNNEEFVSLGNDTYFIVKIFDITGNELDIEKYDVKLLLSINAIGVGSNADDIAEGYRLKLDTLDDLNVDAADVKFGAVEGINPNNMFFYSGTNLDVLKLVSKLTFIDVEGSSIFDNFSIIDYIGYTDEEITALVRTVVYGDMVKGINYKVMIDNKIIESYEVPKKA